MTRGRIRPSEKVLRSLYPAHLDAEIAEIYGVGRRTVCEWRELYGINGVRRQPRRRYFRRRSDYHSLTDDFFETIDTETKAYFLGLLSADGSVAPSGKQFTLSLQARDEHILRDLKRALGSSHPIYDRKSGGGFPGSGLQRAITIGSKKLVSDLAKYGVVPGKSKKLTFPNLPRRLERHFARGAFDGDGHIRAEPKKAFYFLGTEAFIKGLREAIIRHTGVRTLRMEKHVGCWKLAGEGGSAKVLHWLYRNSTVFLKRKKKVYTQVWS